MKQDINNQQVYTNINESDVRSHASTTPSTINNGLTRAVVVNTKDKDYSIGRVQVRIYNRHGIPNKNLGTGYVKDKDLPWAIPITLNASHNSGSFIIPEVGSTVWVLYENNNPNKLVYLGGMFGTGIENDRTLGKTDIRKRKQRKFDLEVPKEVEKGRSDREDMYVLYKSPKGSGFFIADYDNEEEVFLKTPLGEILSLNSHLDTSSDKDFNYKTTEWKDVRKRDFNKWELVREYTEFIYKTVCKSIFNIKSWKSKALSKLKIVTGGLFSELYQETREEASYREAKLYFDNDTGLYLKSSSGVDTADLKVNTGAGLYIKSSNGEESIELRLNDGTGLYITKGNIKIIGNTSIEGRLAVFKDIRAESNISSGIDVFADRNVKAASAVVAPILAGTPSSLSQDPVSKDISVTPVTEICSGSCTGNCTKTCEAPYQPKDANCDCYGPCNSSCKGSSDEECDGNCFNKYSESICDEDSPYYCKKCCDELKGVVDNE